ncbi:MAG: flagellar motor protein MotB [Syntrophales bacterium]|nr:flagellar motor protein MotB [Syntrophales bacterium]
MSDKKIIIRKVKKKVHGEHHGGQWKVAYADFVTAMMAFFLLLWLLAMVSPDKRAQLAQYFNNFSLFKHSGAGFSSGGGASLIGKTDSIQLPPKAQARAAGSEKLKKKLKEAVETKLKQVENQVLIDIHEGGVRIQIVDEEGSLIFPLGSALPTERAKAIISVVSENIRDTADKIVVEGHTDSLPYRGDQITNWELSTSRASGARREMETNGIDPGRIARVVGYADQQLLVKDNPKDPRNRRISIILIPAGMDKPIVIGETATRAFSPMQPTQAAPAKK